MRLFLSLFTAAVEISMKLKANKIVEKLFAEEKNNSVYDKADYALKNKTIRIQLYMLIRNEPTNVRTQTEIRGKNMDRRVIF